MSIVHLTNSKWHMGQHTTYNHHHTVQTDIDIQNEQRKHAMAVAATTAVAADAAVTAAQAVAIVIHLTSASNGTSKSIEEAIKALCALRGLVKLQALVMGHLVRKQAKATLTCMQALVTAQVRPHAQRTQMGSEGNTNQKHKNSNEDNLFKHELRGVFCGLTEEIPTVDKDSWFKD
ncbi:hypothetical protein JHK85_048899 [Glycine max]|nr:hypothetical protein JHK85_048899 [Glycine max]